MAELLRLVHGLSSCCLKISNNMHYTPTTETWRNMTDCVRNLELLSVWCILLEIVRQVA